MSQWLELRRKAHRNWPYLVEQGVEVRYLSAVVEGTADQAVAQALARETGFVLRGVYVKKGKDRIDLKLAAYAQAARYGLWLVIRDLDHDAECAPMLLDSLCPSRPPGLQVRIAVREVEAWLLADREAIASYFGVSAGVLPVRPDELDRPKIALVNVARRARRKEIRRDLVPNDGSSAVVGPAYTARVAEFVTSHWRPRVAARESPSLARAIEALDRWNP